MTSRAAPSVLSGQRKIIRESYQDNQKNTCRLIREATILNAINAMPDGGMLSISAEVSEGEVLIRVSDTGHGIPDSSIDKIFDPFYTTSSVGKGTGLGLSICYSIVKEHCGSIEVDSVEGRGSIFTIKLPCCFPSEGDGLSEHSG
jgi:C4-dicarboxylate-specific signal transduction histidine kinase